MAAKATKRKKNKAGRRIGAFGGGAGRRPGRPEKPLEQVPYTFDEIVQSLVKPVPKEKQETA